MGTRYRGGVSWRGWSPGAATRWALAVVLVLGVLGMHALLGPPAVTGSGVAAPPGMTTSGMTVPVDVAHDVGGGTALAEQSALQGGGSGPSEGHGPAGGHSMLTTCLAVLGALAGVVLVATALVRRPNLLDRPAGARSAGFRSWMGRPPPWTVLSLHQLSLLRV